MNIKKIVLSALVFSISLNVSAQKFDEKEVVTAMGDEIMRNMGSLELTGYPKPFFMSYTLSNESKVDIIASMGSIITVSENPAINNGRVRMLIGDYKSTSEVFYGIPLVSKRISNDADADAVKRLFWDLSDMCYKESLNMYGKKMSFLNSNPRTGKLAKLDDYEQVKTTSYLNPSPAPMSIDVEKWKENMRDLSAVFNDFKLIDNSAVSFSTSEYTAYQVTSEGTLTKTPHSLVTISVEAVTTKDSGEAVKDEMKIVTSTIDELPSLDELKTRINKFAENLLDYSSSESLDERYNGPVLFENGIPNAFLSAHLLVGGGLIAMRPQEGSPMGETLADRIGDRVIDERITIKNYTKMSEYNGKKLIGSYEIDGDGVVPADEITLIEKGEVKALLNGRIPAVGAKNSTGSARWSTSVAMTVTAPGTIHYIAEGTTKEANMKKEFLKLAKKKKKKYAYIVRSLSSAPRIYRVDVKSGEESLVCDAQLGNISLDNLKSDIIEISDEEMVFNSVSPLSTLISVISPRSMIIDDVSLTKKNKAQARKIHLISPIQR